MTNSNVNQTIKGKFVGNEVVTCQSVMVDYILGLNDYDNAPFTWDDVENLYINNSEEIEELEEQIESLESQQETNGDYDVVDDLQEQIDDIQEKIEGLESEQDEMQEVYEWWEVSSYLLDKLQERGEVVIPDMNLWGRCASGQAILLDGVISSICEDMEILEGQSNSWEDFK